MTVDAANDTGNVPRRSIRYRWQAKYPPGVDWDQAFTPKPVYALLDEAVSRHGRKPCTNFLGKVLSYDDISESVDRVAAGLQKIGVRKGTKVGLMLPNSP